MKILFTCVGRRVELLQAFREAAEFLKLELILFGADVSDTAPALFFCDKKIVLPIIQDKNYIPLLLSICENEKIDALIPTIDTDLMLLAENKESFKKVGTQVFVSSPDKIAICRDKMLTADFFRSCNLKAPTSLNEIDKYDLGFPAFIKPKDGSSSINAYKVHNQTELKTYAGSISDYIIQPFINGIEYTVDVFCDLDGEPILITPRVRLNVRAGEVLKTKIRQDSLIVNETKKAISVFRPCGAITIQLIRDSRTGEDFFIEINPRFGGGAPLSMKAGAKSAEIMLRLLRGEHMKYIPEAAEDGAVFSRFDQSIRIR